jgi:hypothetical protein
MDLVDFIIRAKIAGYATGGEKQELKFNDGSIGFKFSTDGYKYIDRYYGFNPFSGTEHVYDGDEVLVWKMNYYGEIMGTTLNPKIIYGFLKEAMASINPEFPFRGPAKMVKESLIYENHQNGNLEAFQGHETIYENKNKIYYLHYHGGTMKRDT